MSIGSKTAVSVLNEYLISKGTTARWDLKFNGTGTHNPNFIYEVEGLGKVAEGEGRSKQQAKQQAALNLIDILGILNDERVAEEVTQVTVPQETDSFNAVGQLADYCVTKQHPEPEYETVKEEGPPHAKIFVVRCAVSKIYEFGESGKKKVAKQIAATNMLRRLKIQAGEDFNAVVPVGAMKAEKKVLEFNEEEVFAKIAENKTTYVPPPAIKYKDHQQALVGIHENSETLAKIIRDEIENVDDVAVELLNLVAEELKVETELKTFSTKHSNGAELYLYKITTNPEVNAVGYDQVSAARNLIDTLTTMST